MGEGVALLMLHELSSVAGEDAETLADRLDAREAEVNARAQELKDREEEVAAAQENVAVIEQNLAQQLRGIRLPQSTSGSKPKLGRNEPCWCKSGKKYKYCHGAV